MIVCLMGPTASGKSALALELARAVGGEIVSADSMQLYRGLAIGTAQPTAAERAEVRHHLLDEFDFSEKIDVYRFIRLADAAIADIERRGRVPIVAGGTGFYVKALLRGLDELPGDDALRRELDDAYDRDDRMDALRRRMRELDPAAETRWHDCRRKLIRALEVRLLAGRSILELQRGERPLRFPTAAFRLEWEPDALRRRIAARTREMLAAGWIDEARAAIAGGLLASPTAHQALGYPLIGRCLAGEFPETELAGRIATATAQLARRQRTWFRHQHPEAAVLTMPADAARAVERIRGVLGA